MRDAVELFFARATVGLLTVAPEDFAHAIGNAVASVGARGQPA